MAALEETQREIQATITETRRIMANLRPSVLDDLGIRAALSWLCRDTEKTYPGTHMVISAGVHDSEIPEELKIVLFRVTQESITNAIRHGKSSQIQIGLERNNGWLQLKVTDNGHGFDSMKLGQRSPTSGIGLSSMEQRIDSTGGIFSISSTPGGGTTVKAEWKMG